ncbi:MAG: response regulator [Pseudomonadota bacterium]
MTRVQEIQSKTVFQQPKDGRKRPAIPLAANEDSAALYAHMQVFLLEDLSPNTAILAAYLNELGFPPAVCASSLAQVAPHQEDLEHGIFGVIFLDVMLPDGKSTALAKQLKAKGVDNVFAYTALNDPGERAELISSGFDAVLNKPLTLRELKHTLSQHLS